MFGSWGCGVGGGVSLGRFLGAFSFQRQDARWPEENLAAIKKRSLPRPRRGLFRSMPWKGKQELAFDVCSKRKQKEVNRKAKQSKARGALGA